MDKLDLERQRKQRSNCQHLLDDENEGELQKKKKIYFCFIDYAKAFHCVGQNNLWKILQ